MVTKDKQIEALVDLVSEFSELMLDLYEFFRFSPRSGADKDDPEGVRYMTVSDTLANTLGDRMYAIHVSIDKKIGARNGKTTSQLDVVRSGSQEQGQLGRSDSQQGLGSPDAVAD